MSDIAWTELKMVNKRLMVCMQRHTKVFRYITAYGETCLKRILTYLDCIKYNEINRGHLYLQKHVSPKNDIKSINILRTGLH